MTPFPCGCTHDGETRCRTHVKWGCHFDQGPLGPDETQHLCPPCKFGPVGQGHSEGVGTMTVGCGHGSPGICPTCRQAVDELTKLCRDEGLTLDVFLEVRPAPHPDEDDPARRWDGGSAA